jgi:hypothetical protein
MLKSVNPIVKPYLVKANRGFHDEVHQLFRVPRAFQQMYELFGEN